MAVAMGVAWGSGGSSQLQLGSGGNSAGGSPPVAMDVMRAGTAKKMAWGADTEKLMDIMVERFSQKKEVKENTGVASTLNLLGAGAGDGGEAVGATGLDSPVIEEFLEVDPDQPLPSDWEKCLDLKVRVHDFSDWCCVAFSVCFRELGNVGLGSDVGLCAWLKTGELYYVNKSTGAKTSEDPRKHQRAAEALMSGVIAPRTPARDFHAMKKVEMLRKSASPGPRTPPPAMTPLLSFATGKRLWGLQRSDDATNTVSVNKATTSWNSSPRAPRFPRANSPSPSVESNLELNLNLSPSRSRSASPSRSPCPASSVRAPATTHAVCTVEMVQHALNFTDSMVTEALKRTAKALGKRPARPSPSPSRLSKSPSSSTSSDGPGSPSRYAPIAIAPSPSLIASQKRIHPVFCISFPNCCWGLVCRWVKRAAAPVLLMLARCSWCQSYVMVGDITDDCPRCVNKKEGSLSVLYRSQLRVTRQRVEARQL